MTMTPEKFKEVEGVLRNALFEMDDEQKLELAYTVRSQSSWDNRTHNIIYTERDLIRLVQEEIGQVPNADLIAIIIRSSQWKKLAEVGKTAMESRLKDMVRLLKP